MEVYYTQVMVCTGAGNAATQLIRNTYSGGWLSSTGAGNTATQGSCL